MTDEMKGWVSPIGSSVADHLKDSLQDPAFKAEYERLAWEEEPSPPPYLPARRTDRDEPRKSR